MYFVKNILGKDMIEIKNLRKEYKVGNKVQIALDELSFTLPSKGMVFVLGKSGSGKTTLMNLIGGLDSPTSGKCIVDGNEISSFNEKEYEDYRNSHVGFVFQDFFLLENSTVYENIAFSLKLQNIKNDELIKQTLSSVDLMELENRYPSEISGGQKQRVAIARAIVKNPHLILADEPTGNLDYRTATQILNLLQELSKDRLVLIVSHNKEEAYRYADLLIKIDEGKVVDSFVRSSSTEDGFLEDNTIVFPYNVKLNKKELTEINKYAKTGDYLLSQSSNRFISGTNNEVLESKIDIEKYKLKHNSARYFSKKIREGNSSQSIIASLLVSIMIVLIMTCFAFCSFDGENILKHVNDFNDSSEFMIEKGFFSNESDELNINSMVAISEEEINEFYELGYEGKIYKLYNKSNILGTNIHSTQLDSQTCYYQLYADMYKIAGRGVLDCDIDYLYHRFAIDGNINVMAGSLDAGFKDNGFVITDYIADCIIHQFTGYMNLSQEEAYQKIIEQDTFNGRYTVKAIIYTGYKEKYQEVIDVYELKNDTDKLSQFEEEFEKLQEKEIYYHFYNELNSSLLISYYIGDMDFHDSLMYDQKNTSINISMPRAYIDTFIDGNRSVYVTKRATCVDDTMVLADGQIYVSYQIYNKLYGTNYVSDNVSDFQEKEITLTLYNHQGIGGGDVIYHKNFKIIGISNDYGDNFVFSENDFEDILRLTIIPYAIIFDDVDNITSIYNSQTSPFNTYRFTNTTYEAVFATNSILKSFRGVFLIFTIVLAVASTLIMCGQISKNVKKKTYDIGVLKGLGLKSTTIMNVFIKQLIFLILIIVSVVSLSLLFVEGLLNKILVINLVDKLPEMLLNKMKVISFDFVVVLSAYLLIAFVSVLTTYILLRSLKKIKPIEIIKSKEI